MSEKTPLKDGCRTSFFGIDSWKFIPFALILCAMEWLLAAFNLVFLAKDLLMGIPLLVIGIAVTLLCFVLFTIREQN